MKSRDDLLWAVLISGALIFGVLGWVLSFLLLVLFIFASVVMIDKPGREKSIFIIRRGLVYVVGVLLMYGFLLLRVKYNF